MKTTNLAAFADDFWSGDFSVDKFFDKEEEEQEQRDSSVSFDDTYGLAIPGDDVHGLELWTHMMDVSVPPVTSRAKPIVDAQNMKTGFYVGKKRGRGGGVEFFPLAVPVKPRSKRLRPAEIRAWKSPPNTETSFSSTSSPVSIFLFPPHDTGPVFLFSKRKPTTPFGEGGCPAFQRRCNHCQATKTPQWRAGPDGPKTLCNACGVRFKSGRLYPEYRPACSPTFSSEVHSNSHRKVLEMRRKREISEPLPGSSPTVES